MYTFEINALVLFFVPHSVSLMSVVSSKYLFVIISAKVFELLAIDALRNACHSEPETHPPFSYHLVLLLQPHLPLTPLEPNFSCRRNQIDSV